MRKVCVRLAWACGFALVLLVGSSPAWANRYCIGGSCTDQGLTVPETCEAVRGRLGASAVHVAASNTLGVYCMVVGLPGGGNSNQPVRQVSSPSSVFYLSDYLGHVSTPTITEASQVVCESACTVTLTQGGEWQLTGPQFLELSLEEGGAIAGAVLAIWALGWGLRQAVIALRRTDGESST